MKNTSTRRRSRPTFRPRLESLEVRLTPTTYTVTSLADSGAGSLRAAITSVNGDTSADVIDFSVAGVIQLTSGALPAITNSVSIEGTKASVSTGAPLVEIDNNGFAGLTLSASNSSIASLSIVNANGPGLTLEGTAGSQPGYEYITVVGNFIGLALDGSVAGNTGVGVLAETATFIGGTTTTDRNVISGNGGGGIQVGSSGAQSMAGATIEGNYIGTDPTGQAAAANQGDGVLVVDAKASIGGTTMGTGNVISGNRGDGIRISGSTATGNYVEGNFIGTASDGTTPLPNGGNGIDFESGASKNYVYGGNVIQNNGQDGVLVQTGSSGNFIASSIFNNGNLGIELQPGANQDQPAPAILGAFTVQGNTLIYGEATGAPNTPLYMYLYASPSAPSTGPGQGQTYLEEFVVESNAAGQAGFSATLPGTSLVGQFLTATATDQLDNTSEFSAGVAVTSNSFASLTIVMYQDVLNRPPAVSDINYWTAQLSSGVSRFVMAQAVWESAEHRTIEVHQYFEQYLYRAPDPAAQTYWVGQMLAGLSETGIQLALLTSPEYIQNPFDPELDHSTITGYITGLYNDVLDRDPAPEEVQLWVDAAAAGATEAQIALAFLTSPEAYSDSLNTYYTEFLKRPPDASGAAFFLNQLETGLATPQSVAETILASDEFFALASGS